MNYDNNNFTYGYEIEYGDIDRTLVIPEHLGTWEFAETDVLNSFPPYKYVACDPLGLEPPMGGEINTKPTKTWQEQVSRILELYNLFVQHGDLPTASPTSTGHTHIHIPGLRDDIAALKRLIAYIKDNQQDTITNCLKFEYNEEMKKFSNAVMYLKYDGGRPMPDYMCDNIINLASDFDSFIRLHAAGKDGVSMGRPFRYAINTYCMKHTDTIEFRCFRSTINPVKLASQFSFVEQFMDAALNNGRSVKQILAEGNFDFPDFVWNAEAYAGYQATVWDKSRGKKERHFYEI